MAIEVSLPLRSIEQPLRDSIRELRRGYQSVSECLEQTMAECDVRSAELADCRRQLAESRRSLSQCEKQLDERARAEADTANRSNALKKQFEARQVELTQANERIARCEAESTQDKQRLELQIEHNQQMRDQIASMESQREATRGELEQLRVQLAPLTESAGEAVQGRADLATAQAELSRLREQLASATPESDFSAQLTAEQALRHELEVELEALRLRGAELSESLCEQKRLAVAEREHWNEELRGLRRAVERQSELLSQRPATAPAHPPEPQSIRPTTPAHSAGTATVIGSVLEQFEMLQKNKIRKLASSSG